MCTVVWLQGRGRQGYTFTTTASQLMDPILRPSDRDNQPSMDADFGMPSKSSREVWEYIRELDEGENWVERNRVVRKSDHILYTKCAQELVGELVDNLPVFSKEQPGSPTVEDTQGVARREEEERTGEKKAEEYQCMNQFKGKDFQTTAAQLDTDYLEGVSFSTDEPSVLACQSLYVQFDPLVGTDSPNKSAQGDIPMAVGVGRVPSYDLNMAILESPLHSVSDSITSIGVVGQNSRKKTPASTSVSVGNLNTTILDTLPPSPLYTSSPIPETDDLVKMPKFAEDDVAHLVEAARQEERKKFEVEMALMRQELLHKESSTQKHVDRAQREIQGMKTEVMMIVSDKAKLEEEVERWRLVVECHEDTETKICDCYEELKGEVSKLEQQQDQTLADFESLEKLFADLHQRYFKLKSIVQTFQRNESKLKSYVAELEGVNRITEENFQALQRDMEEKLAEANETFDTMRKEHASDVAVANANVKKLQLQVANLEKALKGKDQEKEQLAQICDDLMKELRNRD